MVALYKAMEWYFQLPLTTWYHYIVIYAYNWWKEGE